MLRRLLRRAVLETDEAPPAGAGGMLQVTGLNVMKGYLGRDDLTGPVIRDGGYVTGDLGSVDEDGFVRIEGRRSRFSKIGGEMVPHGVVEDALNRPLGPTEHAGPARFPDSGDRRGASREVGACPSTSKTCSAQPAESRVAPRTTAAAPSTSTPSAISTRPSGRITNATC